MARRDLPAPSRRRFAEDYPDGTVVEWRDPPLLRIGPALIRAAFTVARVTGRITGTALVRQGLGVTHDPVLVAEGQACTVRDQAAEPVPMRARRGLSHGDELTPRRPTAAPDAAVLFDPAELERARAAL